MVLPSRCCRHNAELYRRNALQAHTNLYAASPLRAEHFACWLALCTDTVNDHSSVKAELAKLQAERIAESISRRRFHHLGQRARHRPACLV